MARTSFAYQPKPDPGGQHIRIGVFAGPDEQHRANCGTLVMRPQEWADFTDRIAGPGHTILPTREPEQT